MRLCVSCFALAAFSLAFGACDSGGSVTTTAECATVDDCTGTQVCFEGQCVSPSADDTGAADVGTPTDTPSPKDTAPPPKDIGTSPKDTVAHDAEPAPELIPDNTPPKVIKVDPKDGKMEVPVDFAITLTFSEPVKNATDKTIHLRDINGTEIAGVVTKKGTGDTYTWKAKAPLAHASPYFLQVNSPNVILDAAGKKMQGFFESSFFTAPPADMGNYATLAATYAPIIRIGGPNDVPLKAQWDIPVAANLDADWDLADNQAYVENKNTKKLSPVVHYAVLESESHYFVHYVYYWPRRSDVINDEAFSNDAAGAIVVVEKWPAERPVEVLTWFKSSGEYVRAFTTTDSPLVDDGDVDKSVFDGAFPAEELFVDGRFQSWVPGGKHESCLWNDGGQGLWSCKLLAGEKAFYPIWTLGPGAKSGLVPKEASAWPRSGETEYGLVDLISSWWPRRTESGVFWNTTSSYTHNHKGAGMTAAFPRFFIDAAGTGQGQGRTPFAVNWKPADGQTYPTDLKQGVIFFDPPAYLLKRHKTSYFGTPFDPTTKVGFSQEWCFNPYLNIDERGTSEVCP